MEGTREEEVVKAREREAEAYTPTARRAGVDFEGGFGGGVLLEDI